MTPEFRRIIQRHHGKARKLREYAEFLNAEKRGDKEAADRWYDAWTRQAVRLAEREEANDAS